MFNLESKIQQWRKAMVSAGIPPGTTLDELECHLRDDFASSLESGSIPDAVFPEAAFAAALANLGQPEVIMREFEVDESLEPQANPFSSWRNMLSTLRRHRLRIAICFALGLAAAAENYIFSPHGFLNPHGYVSEAKLVVLYVVNQAPATGQVVRPPDARDATIMKNELDLLTSFDLARQVAENIGPEKILPNTTGDKKIDAAAVYIRHHLLVDNPIRSSVIRLSFKDTNPMVVQPILSEVINSYLKLHRDLHRDVYRFVNGMSDRPDVSRVQNVNVFQMPTPPIADQSEARKLFVWIAVAGAFAGIAWAFVIELLRSQSNRPPPSPRTADA